MRLSEENQILVIGNSTYPFGILIGTYLVSWQVFKWASGVFTFVGTATETLIRLLSDFKKDGLIDLNGKKISVLNERALAKEIDLFA